ncbi:hypothetical protein [Aestuariibius sp. HNIBRBA575]|uniref:hypothetical protein n=1 Tax=Aestuariibius sp. HNIBRBA575 TaxID=3233343 RepID=UPI0034A11F5E
MFWSRPMISEDMQDWILECFEWFDDHFEPPKQPILPTKTFFKASGGTGIETARGVLNDIQRHMEFHQQVELAPLDQVSEEYRIDYRATSLVSGTFQNDAGVPFIRFDPDLIKRPSLFINTLAHELMHARLSPHVQDVPGGEGAHELATDLGCIIAGFGVFQMQSADDVGWSGYMSQQSRAYALSVFLQRRNLGPDAVSSHLSYRCNKLLSRAFKMA